MTQVPDYIERRIRQPIPPGLCVVPGSIPVVAFGNSLTAKIATLSLNPSHREFQDKDGCELTGRKRRLATHKSLGVYDLASAPSEIIEQVLYDCQSYFHCKPYGWFNQLERVLKACGASYFDGSACHLDLVQWATKAPWTMLCPKAQSQLLDSDAPFLREQLSNENIKLLLINGISAADGFQRAFCAKLDELSPVEALGRRSQLFDGFILDRVRVIAWSVSVQRGVSRQLRAALAERVLQLTKEL